MELDDLKHTWKNSSEQLDMSMRDERLKTRLTEITRSKHRLVSNILFEFVVATLMYAGVALTLSFYFQQVQLFIIKLIVIIFLGTLPIYYRLYLSMRWLRKIDYGRDIKSNLEEFVRYYRTTIRIYRVGGYVLIAVLFLVFITDTSFHALEAWVQASILIYLLLCALFIKPLTNRFYGRKLKVFESFKTSD